MTETEAQETYPMPPEAKDKELKIPASEIQNVVITPKSGTASSTESSLKVLDKPLKVEGTELEYVILAPKGFKGKAPEKEEEKKEEEKKEDEMNKPEEDVSKKVEALSAENQQLKEQVNQMMMSRREDLTTRIVELRQKKGLAEEKDTAQTISNFKKLDEDQLRILLSDAEQLTKVDTKAETKVKLSASDGLSEEQKLRQSLFGHKDPLGGE